jgi:hypothetical protein
MNTTNINNIKTAIISALLADKPSLKISEKLEQNLVDAIIDQLPEQREDRPSPEVLAAFSKSLSERGIWLDSNNTTLTHIPDSQLFSRHEGQDGPLVNSHDFQLDKLAPDWNTILRLVTMLVIKHKRARPSKLDEGNNLQLHLAAEALEALQLINGDITLDDTGTAVSSSAPSFDFLAHGLNSEHFVTDKPKAIYTMPRDAGTKLYLKAEYRHVFDDLADAGILSEDYGRNKVKDGEFVGNFAVLCIN